MKVAAAKAALLTSALRASAPPAFAALRYDDTRLTSLKDAKFDAAYSAAGKADGHSRGDVAWTEPLRLRGANR